MSKEFQGLGHSYLENVLLKQKRYVNSSRTADKHPAAVD